MELFQILAFVLISAMLTALVRQYLPAYGLLCLLGCSVILLLYLVGFCEPIIQWFYDCSEYLDQSNLTILLKTAGIALTIQTAQDICKDAGMTALAGKVELAGRCFVILCALPLFQKILDSLVVFLQ